MSPTEVLPQQQQPLVTVKDYRPSCHSSASNSSSSSSRSSSSAASGSSEADFDFEPETPCPFAHLPKKSRYGKLYSTRYANGLWAERPIITTVQTPFRLRCWAINGPHEFYDQHLEREPFSIDDDTVVPMTGLALLAPPREQPTARPPRPNVSVGKISPLQKCYIKIARPPREKQRSTSSRSTASSKLDGSDMLSPKSKFVQDPCGLSDSSSDTESQLHFTSNRSVSSSNSASINFCLPSDAHTSSEETHHQFDHTYQAALLAAADGASLTNPQEQMQSLTHRAEQLTSLANSLQSQLTACDREKMQLQQQVQALQSMQCSSEESTSPPNSATDNSEETLAKRHNCRSKALDGEGERLRMELLQERQRTAEVLLENERLLTVILKLKCEMDLEHDLYEHFQKKTVAEQAGGKWQMLRQMVRSSSALRDSKKRPTYQRARSFIRSRSRKR